MAAPTWTPCTVTLGSLKPWAANPRLSTKAQAKRILASFARFGQVLPVAIGPESEVYDGHQRLSALLTVHGPDYAIDARRASRPLTDDERRALVVTLHAGAVGAWNWDDLAGWDAQALGEWGMDAAALKQWNTDAAALATMLETEKPPAVDAEPQIDRAEEMRVKWGVEPGQLWRLGEHRLICGDCTDAAVVERVMQGEKAGAVVTDPPYGLGKSKSFNDDHPDYEDFEPFDLSLIDLASDFVVWGGQYYDPLPVNRNKIGWIVWDKRPNLDGEKRERADRRFGQHFEIAITNVGKLRGKMLRHTWGGYYGGEEILHKTQKPIGLIADCVKETDGDVLDYFSGSGTTIIACERLGRRCRAVEISPAYVAVALERWAQATGGTPELME